MRKTVTFLTDVEFSEISLVDKPANDLATINHVSLAKRAEPVMEDLSPEERGIFKKLYDRLFKAGPDKKSQRQVAYLLSSGSPLDEGQKKRLKDELHAGTVVVDNKAADDGVPEGFVMPEGTKVAKDLRKGLYDVGMLAESVQRIDFVVESSADMAERLGAVRKELGSILVDMAQEEVAELGKAAGTPVGEATMTAEELEQLIKSALGVVREEQKLEKKGAKMSAANLSHLNNAKGSFKKAMSYFGKCDKAASSDDFDNGVAHHQMGMSHLEKMDLEPTSDRIHGGPVKDEDTDDIKAAKAGASGDLIKAADLEKHIEEATKKAAAVLEERFKAEREEVEKRHKVELENAELKAINATLGKMPITPKAHIGGVPGDLRTVQKGASNALAVNGGTQDPEVVIDPNDPQAFQKSLALRRPRPLKDDPTFHGSLNGGGMA